MLSLKKLALLKRPGLVWHSNRPAVPMGGTRLKAEPGRGPVLLTERHRLQAAQGPFQGEADWGCP